MNTNTRVVTTVLVVAAIAAGVWVTRARADGGALTMVPEPAGLVAAGDTYTPATDPAALRQEASGLWTWDGDVGTYIGGTGRIRVDASGVTVLESVPGLTDKCLIAQLTTAPTADVTAAGGACAGMWQKPAGQ